MAEGLLPGILPDIFDRFYRTDASRNSQKGGKRNRSFDCKKDY